MRQVSDRNVTKPCSIAKLAVGFCVLGKDTFCSFLIRANHGHQFFLLIKQIASGRNVFENFD